MKRSVTIFIWFVIVTGNNFATDTNNCIRCHRGIEPIRSPESGMMKEIEKLAAKANYPDNTCIVCHGGNPDTGIKGKAHSGVIGYFQTHDGPKDFYPDPGSPWINKNTCGMCHKEEVSAQMNSLMMTEQGKIQGTLWGFGGLEGYRHDIGNYVTANVAESERLGTEAYRKYMYHVSQANPQVYPEKMKELPPAPTAGEVEQDPSLAAYTYLRQECLRCHTGSKGRKRRGDFRGIGCSSCHIPYSNNGFYEGADPAIDKTEPGHMLVHAIQATRESGVTVHGTTYSGIPVETCTTCHNRGKRIGVSYQGLMETAYSPTYDRNGNQQPALHTKHYLRLQEDVHYRKGMLCQDCHTSLDVHGDGYISGSTLAPVEIECQDCHGTPRFYPWELPLGYGDEFALTPANGPARGVSPAIPEYLKKGTAYDSSDGYLISSRGNPIGNTVKTGDSVLVHLSSGKDLVLQPLKKLTREKKLSKEGEVAMVQIGVHMDRMECYACHATWAPQCYGCHIKIDYSRGARHVDWLASAHDHDRQGRTGAMRNEQDKYLVDGEVTETRSYLRWEDPPLSRNGEGRISPTIPGCQTTVTVVGKDGKALIQNHIFRIPDVEGSGDEGQLGIDMSPVQPHTIRKEARDCESCHGNAAALGYGIHGGKYFADPSEDFFVDLETADQQVIPEKVTVQKPGIPNLKADWSRFVTEEGKQLQTVGHHFKLSAPLDDQTRQKLDRRGTCLSCHQTMPGKDLAVSLMTHTSEVLGLNINTAFHNQIMHKLVLLGAWVQFFAGLIAGALIIFLIFRFFRKKKLKKA